MNNADKLLHNMAWSYDQRLSTIQALNAMCSVLDEMSSICCDLNSKRCRELEELLQSVADAICVLRDYEDQRIRAAIRLYEKTQP